MEIFINEVSLEGQYFTKTEFEQSIKTFRDIFSLIDKEIKNKKLYKDSQVLVNREAIKGFIFQASLSKVNIQLKEAIRRIIFNRHRPKEWRDEQVHSTDDNFDYITTTKCLDVKNTSLAEVAERSLQNKETTYLLINFKNSQFTQKHQNISECFLIPIIKNNDKENPINLDCLDEKSALEKWIKIKLNPYDENSTSPPTDEQTILCDRERFEKTTIIAQGRARYKEIHTCTTWYVDNSHYGTKAHLEVFDKHGKHIGEADLQGNIDNSKRKLNRTLS